MKLVFYRSKVAKSFHIIQPNMLQSSFHDSSVNNEQVSMIFFLNKLLLLTNSLNFVKKVFAGN